jgi:hypothetical protein
MDEAPETPKTGNVIQPLVKNYVPPQVTRLSTFERSRLTQSDPLSTFNPKKCVVPAPMQFQHRTVKRTLVAYLAVRISVNKPSGKIVFRILKTVAPSKDSTYNVGTDAPY